MFRIKLSPLILFLILLFVLLLSVVFSKHLPLYEKKDEGFISFDYSNKPDKNLKIPQYSLTRNVNKIYDSIYFDQSNGNLIMLFGKDFNGQESSANDINGSSLTEMHVITRDGSSNKYNFDYSKTKPEDITPVVSTSLLSSGISSTYKSWSYPSIDSNANYQVFYTQWDRATIIHLVDVSGKSLMSTHLYDTGNTHLVSGYNPVPYPTGSYTDVSNNAFSDDATYKGKTGTVYQVGDYVGFDTVTGHLLVQNGTGASRTTDVYSGTLNSERTPRILKKASVDSPYTPKDVLPLDKRGFNPIVVVSDKESAIVVYVPYRNNTAVSLLSLDTNYSNLLMLTNTVRFNPKTVGGIDTASNNSTLYGSYSNDSNDSNDSDVDVTNIESNDSNVSNDNNDDKKCDNDEDYVTPPSLDSIISNYYKKYWDKKYKPGDKYSDDFLLKTQIVPPICPSCPNCPSKTTCTNCGGNGGSGVLDVSGSSLASRKSGNTNVYNLYENPNEMGIGQTIDSLVKTAGNTIGEVAGDATNLAGKIVDNTSGLLYSTGSGIKHAVGDLGRDGYYNGYGGPSKYSNAGSGTQGTVTSGNSASAMPNTSIPYSSYTLPPSTIDPYSYQGALSSKGGNPLPILNDFSSFSK